MWFKFYSGFSSFLFIFLLFSLVLDMHGVLYKEKNYKKTTDIYIYTHTKPKTR